MTRLKSNKAFSKLLEKDLEIQAKLFQKLPVTVQSMSIPKSELLRHVFSRMLHISKKIKGNFQPVTNC
jgi:hypothetical protein